MLAVSGHQSNRRSAQRARRYPFPSGTPRLQTTVAFRNTGSGKATQAQVATLRRAPGKLAVDQPAGVTLRGHQGGPFAPAQFTFNVAAQGLGFHWQIEGTPPAWLEVTPVQGDLHDNSSMAAIVKAKPAAASLGPGTYETQLFFRDADTGEVIGRQARLIVDPPTGRLAVDVPTALYFTGPQGGPFAPQRIAFNLKAAGLGFKWTVEAPPWLEIVPAQGEVRDNGSIEVAARPRPSAQALTPATYESRITFKKTGPDQSVVQTVRLVVSVNMR
jgi:hypothetical protein